MYQHISAYLDSLAPSPAKTAIFGLLRKLPTDGRDPALIKAPDELSAKDLTELGRLFHDSFGQTPTALHEPYWLETPFFADDTNRQERKQLSQDFMQGLYDTHDDALLPMIQEIELEGFVQPHTLRYAQRHRRVNTLPTHIEQRFDALMTERETYRATKIHDFGVNDTVHQPVYDAVVAEMQQ